MSAELVVLPSSAAVAGWTPQQRALMVFAGIAREIMTNGTKTTIVPDPGVAEAFLMVCKRTGLDPFAKQIYAIEVAGRLTIVVGVDGFRIVAQRSQGYEGQVGPQWFTGRNVEKPMIVDGHAIFHQDGSLVMERVPEWVDAWTPEVLGLDADAKPVAARVGVYRKGFRDPLWQVVTWKEFGVEPRYRTDNWGVRPAHMLGIRAETHALRRAFPNDLSGLYTPEDFDDQSGELTEDIQAEVEKIRKISDLAELTRYYQELHAIGMAEKVREEFMRRAGDLQKPPAAPPAEDGGAAEVDADTDKPQIPIAKRKLPKPAPEPEPAAEHRPARGEPTMRQEPAVHEMTEEEWEAQERARAEAELGGE